LEVNGPPQATRSTHNLISISTAANDLKLQRNRFTAEHAYNKSGYSTPAKGVQSVEAEAKMTFLSFAQENSETKQIDGFAPRQRVQIGPLNFCTHKAVKG
jgi:hypothetical protein